MEIKLGDCKKGLQRFVWTFIIGFFIIILIKNETARIAIIALLSLFIFFELLRLNNYPVFLLFKEGEIKIQFCKFFGFSERKETVYNNSVFFIRKTEPYIHGVRNFVKVCDKKTMKTIFKVTNNTDGENNLHEVIEYLIKFGVEERDDIKC